MRYYVILMASAIGPRHITGAIYKDVPILRNARENIIPVLLIYSTRLSSPTCLLIRDAAIERPQITLYDSVGSQ